MLTEMLACVFSIRSFAISAVLCTPDSGYTSDRINLRQFSNVTNLKKSESYSEKIIIRNNHKKEILQIEHESCKKLDDGRSIIVKYTGVTKVW